MRNMLPPRFEIRVSFWNGYIIKKKFCGFVVVRQGLDPFGRPDVGGVWGLGDVAYIGTVYRKLSGICRKICGPKGPSIVGGGGLIAACERGSMMNLAVTSRTLCDVSGKHIAEIPDGLGAIQILKLVRASGNSVGAVGPCGEGEPGVAACQCVVLFTCRFD